MKHSRLSLSAVGTLLVAQTAFAQISISIVTSNDTFMRTDRSYLANGTTDNMDFRFDFTSYFQFDMSALNIDTITDASLTLYKVANARNDTMVTARVEMYGLSALAGNTEQNWDETDGGWQTRVLDQDHGMDFRNVGSDWLGGTGAVSANLTLLDQDLGASVTESVSGDVYTLSGPALVDFLNTRADADGFVTFVVENPLTDGKGWGWATKEHADSGLHPTLDLTYSEMITVIPEPSVLALLAGLGAFAMGIRRRR